MAARPSEAKPGMMRADGAPEIRDAASNWAGREAPATEILENRKQRRAAAAQRKRVAVRHCACCQPLAKAAAGKLHPSTNDPRLYLA